MTEVGIKCGRSVCSADVMIHWARTDGSSIPPHNRISRRDYDTRLEIAQLQRSDEGHYSCTGSDSTTGSTLSTEFPLQLFVHGKVSHTCGLLSACSLSTLLVERVSGITDCFQW